MVEIQQQLMTPRAASEILWMRGLHSEGFGERPTPVAFRAGAFCDRLLGSGER